MPGIPPKAGIKLSLDKWRQPRTLQKPSISTPVETDPCFIGVFHTLNQRRAHFILLKTKHVPFSQAGRRRFSSPIARSIFSNTYRTSAAVEFGINGINANVILS